MLANVVPNDLMVLYSKMADSGERGAVPLKYVETLDHGSVIDVGDLVAGAARRVAGRLTLPVGERLPPDSTVTLFRQTAWDFLTVPVADDGTFATHAIPEEPLSLSVGVRGYRLADKYGRARRAVPLAPLERDRTLSLPLEPAPAAPPR